MFRKEICEIVRDKINKDIEKKVKDIVANCVNTLFKTLWQRRNFYENEIKNN